MSRIGVKIGSALIVMVLLSSCSSTASTSGAAVGGSTADSIPASASAGSTSAGPSTSKNSTATSAASSSTPETTSSSAGGSGTDLATVGCSAIKIADAQALVKSTVTKIDFEPGSAELDPRHLFICQFDNQYMRITVNPEDASSAIYNEEVVEQNVSTTPIAGVGDAAVWAGVLLGGVITSAPTVIAHKGSVTCLVETPGGPDLTIPIDPGPIGGSTPADAAAFAAKTAALCTDIFSAVS